MQRDSRTGAIHPGEIEEMERRRKTELQYLEYEKRRQKEKEEEDLKIKLRTVKSILDERKMVHYCPNCYKEICSRLESKIKHYVECKCGKRVVFE